MIRMRPDREMKMLVFKIASESLWMVSGFVGRREDATRGEGPGKPFDDTRHLPNKEDQDSAMSLETDLLESLVAGASDAED